MPRACMAGESLVSSSRFASYSRRCTVWCMYSRSRKRIALSILCSRMNAFRSDISSRKACVVGESAAIVQKIPMR